MSSQLGPIDVCCDAPPYPIVEACVRLGFQAPLDVRWCRWDRFSQRGDLDSSFGLSPWTWFAHAEPFTKKTCTCGSSVPLLERYSFILASEMVIEYQLGQCARCGTMYWQEE